MGKITDSKKSIPIIIIASVIGVGLLVLSPKLSSTDPKTEEDDTGEYYTVMLEEKIEKFLSSVSGIDNVSVIVTLDCGSTKEYAEKEADTSASDYLILNRKDGEEALMLREIYPRVRGIAVTCSGGDTAGVKEKVTYLVSTGLGIRTNMIAVSGSE